MLKWFSVLIVVLFLIMACELEMTPTPVPLHPNAGDAFEVLMMASRDGFDESTNIGCLIVIGVIPHEDLSNIDPVLLLEELNSREEFQERNITWEELSTTLTHCTDYLDRVSEDR